MSEEGRNDPMPWQTTVGDIRKALAGAPDDIPVCLLAPEGGVAEGTIVNIFVAPYENGPIVKFAVGRKPSSSAAK